MQSCQIKQNQMFILRLHGLSGLKVIRLLEPSSLTQLWCNFVLEWHAVTILQIHGRFHASSHSKCFHRQTWLQSTVSAQSKCSVWNSFTFLFRPCVCVFTNRAGTMTLEDGTTTRWTFVLWFQSWFQIRSTLLVPCCNTVTQGVKEVTEGQFIC